MSKTISELKHHYDQLDEALAALPGLTSYERSLIKRKEDFAPPHPYKLFGKVAGQMIHGFGDTPEEAIDNYHKRLREKNLLP